MHVLRWHLSPWLAPWAGLGLLIAAPACTPRHAELETSVQPAQDILRLAQDAPERFLRTSADSRRSAAEPEASCPRRLLDPRDSTQLLLRRSQHEERRSVARQDARSVTTTEYWNYQGDYSVDPVGRYGITDAEWLRVDCLSGRAIGVVPRGAESRDRLQQSEGPA